MIKYFPQLHASFRRIFLSDVKLTMSKKKLIEEEVFPLNFNAEVLNYVENFYNYELHISELFEK